jgi:hypothetical protein
MEKFDIAPFTARDFEPDHKVRYCQRMLNEFGARALVAFGPVGRIRITLWLRKA